MPSSLSFDGHRTGTFSRPESLGFCHNTDLRQMQKTDLEREYITGQIRRLDRIFALHAEQKRTIQDIYDVPKEKIQVIGMGYNSHIFKNESLRVNDGVTRIAFAGKISVKKGSGKPDPESGLSGI